MKLYNPSLEDKIIIDNYQYFNPSIQLDDKDAEEEKRVVLYLLSKVLYQGISDVPLHDYPFYDKPIKNSYLNMLINVFESHYDPTNKTLAYLNQSNKLMDNLCLDYWWVQFIINPRLYPILIKNGFDRHLVRQLLSVNTRKVKKLRTEFKEAIIKYKWELPIPVFNKLSKELSLVLKSNNRIIKWSGDDQ